VIILLFLAAISPPLAAVAQERKRDESAVKAAVESLLVALGNGELERVRAMMLPNANVASISMSNGEHLAGHAGLRSRGSSYTSQPLGQDLEKDQWSCTVP